MRVLVTTQPAPSHLAPMVPYLRALEEAGHEVLVAAAASFVPNVVSLGLQAEPCGLDWLETEASRTFPELDDMDGAAQRMYFLQHIFAGAVADGFAEGLPQLIERWQPDVVLWEYMEWAAHAVAEQAGLPHACVAIGGRIPPFGLRMLIGETLDARRAALGLEPDPEALAPYLHGCATLGPVQWLLPIDPTPMSTERFFHPVPDYAPQALTRGDGNPLVYVTLGTVFNAMPGVMECLVEGLAQGPWDVLVTIGRNRDLREFGPQPQNVRIEQFVPQRDFLHDCAAVVHHAGFGTTMDALVARVPQLVLPLSADQATHSEALLRHGIGQTVPAALDEGFMGLRLVVPDRLTPDAVRDAAATLLADETVRPRLAEFSDMLDALPRQADFVRFVEGLAS